MWCYNKARLKSWEQIFQIKLSVILDKLKIGCKKLVQEHKLIELSGDYSQAERRCVGLAAEGIHFWNRLLKVLKENREIKTAHEVEC